ncbi:toll/interleukin-1 receptor domain-containing protein [Paractinoplanes toevensis]|uniref:TIR domain-containing protein n=1 Tax=Paractinoplanes toevensis TaxID=571911 RepID=A0A919VZ75_9ACTN|nr:TIR domain-containing protein [Actinoplanes toevensis]GIM89837.1 hypothetical protein Ato02nite_016300 [Actinoplanes toevensis]
MSLLPRESGSGTAGYHAFISYAHRHDQTLAAALQREVRRFGVPFYRHQVAFPAAPPGAQRRPLRIFRDASNLTAAASLPDELRRAIGSSQWLILMASPDAASSPWVREEVRVWLAKDPTASRVLIALTDGDIVTTSDSRCIDSAATNALPAELVAALNHVPLWIDLRTARSAVDVGPGRRGRLGDVVADFAAPIQGVDKDVLIGEHLRQQRRTLRTAFAAVAVVTSLAVVASVLAVVAFRARGEAIRQRDTAVANQLVAEAGTIADTQPGLARQLLAAAGGIRRTPQVTGALVTGRSIPQEVQIDADAAAFSPDGRLVVLAQDGNEPYELSGRTVPAAEGFLRLLDVGSLTEIGNIPLGRNSADGLAFLSGPGRRLAAGFDTRVRIWDVQDAANPREQASLTLNPGGEGVDVMAFHEGRAATVDDGHELRLWDVSQPNAPQLLTTQTLSQLQERSFSQLAFSPDRRRLVLSGISRGPMFLDVSTPTNSRAIPDVPALAQVQDLAYAPEGGWVMTTGRETVPRRWRLRADGTPERPDTLPLTAPGATVTSAVSGPQGQLAAVSEEGAVLVWNNALDDDPPALVATLAVPEFSANNVDAMQFSPSGRQLMMLSPRANTGPDGAGSRVSTMRIWQMADGRQPGAASARTGGRTIAVHEHILATLHAGRIYLHDLRQEGAPTPAGSLRWDEDGDVGQMVFNPSGTRLAVLSDNHVLAVDTSDPRRPTPAGEWTITGLPDVCPPGGGLCGLWSAVFRDDAILAVGDSSRQVTLIDTARPGDTAPLGSITTSYGSVTEMAVLRPQRGNLILVTTGLNHPAIELFDITDPAHIKPLGSTCGGGTLTKEGDGYRCRGGTSMLDLATDRSGRLLASADRAGTTRVWQSRDGTLSPIATLQDTGDVQGLALSPDGHRLATIGRDRTLRTYVVNPSTVTLEAIIHIGSGADTNLAFAGNNHTLIGTMRYGLIDIWELDPNLNTTTLCAGSGPRITPDQWNRDIPDLPYAPPC